MDFLLERNALSYFVEVGSIMKLKFFESESNSVAMIGTLSLL